MVPARRRRHRHPPRTHAPSCGRGNPQRRHHVYRRTLGRCLPHRTDERHAGAHACRHRGARSTGIPGLFRPPPRQTDGYRARVRRRRTRRAEPGVRPGACRPVPGGGHHLPIQPAAQHPPHPLDRRRASRPWPPPRTSRRGVADHRRQGGQGARGGSHAEPRARTDGGGRRCVLRRPARRPRRRSCRRGVADRGQGGGSGGYGHARCRCGHTAGRGTLRLACSISGR